MQLTFTIIQPNGQDTKLYTAEGEIVVCGRSDQCDVILENDYVSGTHAQIQCAGKSFFIQDLKSANGTTLNGKAVQGLTRITENSIVEFGTGGPKIRVLSIESAPVGKLNPGPVAGPTVPRESERALAESQPQGGPRRPGLGAVGAFRYSKELVVLFAVLCLACVAVMMSRDSPAPPKPGSSSTGSPSDNTAATEVPKDNSVPLNEVAGIPERLPDPVATANAIRDRVVWIGLKVRSGEQDLVYPVCSGWCISKSEVITTGSVLSQLQNAETKGTVVVYSSLLPASQQHFSTVSKLRVHPKYRPESSTDLTSTENNIGLIELTDPILFPGKQHDAVATSVEWREWNKSREANGLIRCGYQIHSSLEPISAVDMPEFSWGNISVTQLNANSEGLNRLPVARVMNEKSGSPFHGHVVVDYSGRILGTLEKIDNESGLLIPIDRITDLK